MYEEYFKKVAPKLQDELVQVITSNKEVSDYELIVYKYVFSKELGIPLLDDLAIEIDENSFILHVIPDNLLFNKLRLLDDVFDKFEIMFMPNSYNILKLKFSLV